MEAADTSEDRRRSSFGRAGSLPVLAIVILLVVLGLLIYSNVLRNGVFLFDDFEYVVDNPLIRNPSLFADMTDPRQIGYLSFSLNYALSGDSSPFGYHLVNVLIHIANAIMVFFLLRIIMSILRPADSSVATPSDAGTMALPGLAALIFLAHPLETQAVSYVTQRFTSLSALFYIFAILSYLAARVRFEKYAPGRAAYSLLALSLCSTVLAMKTKEVSFTIPFMMAAFELLLFRNSSFSKRRFYFLIPFLATLIIIPLSLFGPEWGIMAPGRGVDEITRRDKLYDLFLRSPYEYLLTQFRVIVMYIRLMVFPVRQLAVYDLRASTSFFELSVVLSLLLLLSLAAAAAWCWRRARRAEPANAADLRLVTLGMVWFFITLSIESSVIPIKDLIFEHRAYLPSIGFFVSLSVVLLRLAGKVAPDADLRLRAALVSAVIVIPLSAATYMRNQVWTDEVLFWDDVVQKTGKAIGYNNRGNAYLKAGKYELALKDLDKTISFFPSATDRLAWENSDFIPVNMAKTYMSRATVYAALGDRERANADNQMAREMMMIAPGMSGKR